MIKTKVTLNNCKSSWYLSWLDSALQVSYKSPYKNRSYSLDNSKYRFSLQERIAGVSEFLIA
jgi:hypothetical protein